MKSIYAFVAVIALLIAALPAEGRMRVVEQGYEANPQLLVLPSAPGGTMTLKDCATCAPRTLTTSTSTRFQLWNEDMPLSAFAQLLRDNPTINLTVMTDARTGVVTRIQVQAEPANSRSR
jgi:hypothetical protein